MFDILRIRDAPRVHSMPFIIASRTEGGILQFRLVFSSPSLVQYLAHFVLYGMTVSVSHLDTVSDLDIIYGLYFGLVRDDTGMDWIVNSDEHCVIIYTIWVVIL